MTVSLQDVKTEIAARAGTIAGLRCYAEAPPTPQPPALGVRGPLRWFYSTTFDEDWTIVLALDLFVNPSDLMRAQQKLDSYIAPVGAESVKYALEHHEITSGVIQSLRVLGGNTSYFYYGEEQSTRLLACTIEVEVVPYVE